MRMKYDDCRDLEKQLGLNQHRIMEGAYETGELRRRYQRRLHCYITVAFVVAWIVVVATSWTLAELSIDLPDVHSPRSTIEIQVDDSTIIITPDATAARD